MHIVKSQSVEQQGQVERGLELTQVHLGWFAGEEREELPTVRCSRAPMGLLIF